MLEKSFRTNQAKPNPRIEGHESRPFKYNCVLKWGICKSLGLVREAARRRSLHKALERVSGIQSQ